MSKFGKKSKSSKKKSNWCNIGSIFSTKKDPDRYFFSANDDEYCEIFIIDKKKGIEGKVKAAALFPPKDGAPDSLQFNVAVNLDNEDAFEESE